MFLSQLYVYVMEIMLQIMGNKDKYQKREKLSICFIHDTLSIYNSKGPSTNIFFALVKLKNKIHTSACLHDFYVGNTVSGKKNHLKVHKNEIFFGSECEFCTISLLVMLKY
jgi:hypothetical protein